MSLFLFISFVCVLSREVYAFYMFSHKCLKIKQNTTYIDRNDDKHGCLYFGYFEKEDLYKSSHWQENNFYNPTTFVLILFFFLMQSRMRARTGTIIPEVEEIYLETGTSESSEFVTPYLATGDEARAFYREEEEEQQRREDRRRRHRRVRFFICYFTQHVCLFFFLFCFVFVFSFQKFDRNRWENLWEKVMQDHGQG